jgi:hypothetical protein
VAIGDAMRGLKGLRGARKIGVEGQVGDRKGYNGNKRGYEGLGGDMM